MTLLQSHGIAHFLDLQKRAREDIEALATTAGQDLLDPEVTDETKVIEIIKVHRERASNLRFVIDYLTERIAEIAQYQGSPRDAGERSGNLSP